MELNLLLTKQCILLNLLLLVLMLPRCCSDKVSFGQVETSSICQHFDPRFSNVFQAEYGSAQIDNVKSDESQVAKVNQGNSSPGM